MMSKIVTDEDETNLERDLQIVHRYLTEAGVYGEIDKTLLEYKRMDVASAFERLQTFVLLNQKTMSRSTYHSLTDLGLVKGKAIIKDGEYQYTRWAKR